MTIAGTSVCVAGAGGYIGSALVKALARERVGQPKASRVIVPKLERETGGAAARGSKHKEKFEKLI